MKTRKLTDKQQCFVNEYLVDLNATAAANRAGYRQPNKQGPRLLVNVGIAEAIASAQTERAERTNLDADWVIDRLKSEATLTGKGATHQGRVRALELLGKHLGLFLERVEVSGQSTIEVTETIVTTRKEAKEMMALINESNGGGDMS